MSLSVEMERIYMLRSFTHVSRWGQKIIFFHKLLKVILLNFIAIFADSEVEISCLKMISDLKKRRLFLMPKNDFRAKKDKIFDIFKN